MGALIEFLFDVWYFLSHWRSSLCFWSAVILAFWLIPQIPWEWLRWVVGFSLAAGSILLGNRWEDSVDG